MPRVTIPDLQRMKREKQKIVMMTVYDFQMARIIDRAGVDILLVGDSGGRSLLGHEDTNNVTMDEMVLMTRSVSRGSKHALVVADMPFMSYQVAQQEAIRNAGRLIREGGAQVVKLEVGSEYSSTVEAIVKAGVPVMGHMGVTPMGTIGSGGFRSEAVHVSEEKVWKDAQAIGLAGAFSLFLSRVPRDLARRITQELSILTITGSGAADVCDGRFGFTHGVVGFSVEALDRPQAAFQPVGVSLYEAVRRFSEEARADKRVPSQRNNDSPSS